MEEIQFNFFLRFFERLIENAINYSWSILPSVFDILYKNFYNISKEKKLKEKIDLLFTKTDIGYLQNIFS